MSTLRLCRQYLIRKKKSFREVFETMSAVSDKEKQASVKFFEAMSAGSEKENKLP